MSASGMATATDSQGSAFARLAVVFADPMRLKIVTELFMREMSPSQFHATFAPGDPFSRVVRHFRRLVETGWLRLVRTATGGHRRGATEYFYRAPELAIFDNETWEQLPPSLKTEFSWRIFEQFAEQVKLALEAGTFDARVDRHFTWTPLVLDDEGQTKVIQAVDALFELLFEEQADAKVRLADSGEKPIQVTVGLAAFDSPRLSRNRSGLLLPPLTEEAARTSAHFTVRVAKVFRHPLNLKIIKELNLREMSPSRFSEEFEVKPSADVYRRFKMLAEDGWLTMVGAKSGGRRRGATEKFYRATGPAIFDTRSWAEAPGEIRESCSWRIFEQLAEQVREAMEEGTFDRRPDRHHTWVPIALDEVGWDQVIKAVDELFASLTKEQDAAKLRLATSCEEPAIATAYLAAFESPERSGNSSIGY